MRTSSVCKWVPNTSMSLAHANRDAFDLFSVEFALGVPILPLPINGPPSGRLLVTGIAFSHRRSAHT